MAHWAFNYQLRLPPPGAFIYSSHQTSLEFKLRLFRALHHGAAAKRGKTRRVFV
jgi:hypothetical protein